MKTWKDLETTHCMYCVGYPIDVSSLQLAFSRYLVEITVVLLVKYEIQPQLFAAAATAAVAAAAAAAAVVAAAAATAAAAAVAPELELHSGFVK